MTIYFYHTKKEYGSFSNFSRHSVVINDKKWPTSEHYYQAMKFESEDLQEQVRALSGPGEAADMGRDRSLPLKKNWSKDRDVVMTEVVRAKFSQHEDLKNLLVGTGDEYLVENSPIDYYWGCGYDKSGANMLGRILMLVRNEFKKQISISEED